MLCVAIDKDEVSNCAVNTPPLLANVTGLPRFTPPSWNCTVPLGVPPETATVAVKLTLWPKNDGFSDDASEVVVAALFTLNPAALLVLLACTLSVGVNAAEIVCVPAGALTFTVT